MTFKRIEAILLHKIGLHAETIGKAGVVAAVRSRMGALGITQEPDYLRRLSLVEGELQALIEEVVVSESWFFREPAAYELMRERALSARSPGGTIRVLSLPCATGEEPYSVVMMLLESGLLPSQIEVYGVDVSANALQRARRGHYTRNSFRTQLTTYTKYFEEVADGFQLSDAVRGRVQFLQGNVLDTKLLSSVKFHAVFCRNLLIYLDKSSRLAALDNLKRLLRPDGVLFVGHSEAGDVAASGLARTGDARCFAFSVGGESGARGDLRSRATGVGSVPTLPRGGAASELRPSQLVKLPSRPPRARSLRPSAREPTRSIRPGSLRPAPRASSPLVGSRPLEQARALADRGALEEALKACEGMLREGQRDPEVLSLLGVVQRARGNLDAARESFLSVLALDPNHYETLIHLALLAEHDGDKAAARGYRARAYSAVREG